MKASRRKSREIALQMLAWQDVNATSPDEVLRDFEARFKCPAEAVPFARQLFVGVLQHKDGLDRQISAHSKAWRLERMTVVDRNILRLATYEFGHVSDVPEKVSMNEAIELAKRFGDEKSAKFVNGVLDAICRNGGSPQAQEAS